MFTQKPVVLVVDDDYYTRQTLFLGMKTFYSIFQASTRDEAFRFLRLQKANVILLDVKIPERAGQDPHENIGFKTLRKIKNDYPDVEVIMISSIKTAATVVRATKAGAYNYFTKDLDIEEIMVNIDNALDKQSAIMEKVCYKAEIKKYINSGFVVGNSPKMKAVCQVIDRISNINASVLITGQSGTGKELVARMVHTKSRRADKPFVAINMASLPDGLVESILFGHVKGAFTGATETQPGKFEMANGGTLFLDEIGELKPELQAKLLRVIQSGEVEMIGSKITAKVNVRLIAATNADLKKKVEEGAFREDLYYRLYVIPIHLPTLSERAEDIPLLVKCFMEKFRLEYNKPGKKITKEAVDALALHPWPGNIRELENLMARVVAVSENDVISIEDIPIEYHVESLLQQPPKNAESNMLVESIRSFETNLIIQVLRKNNMSKTRAAASLGIALSTFKHRIKKLGIDKILKKKHTF